MITAPPQSVGFTTTMSSPLGDVDLAVDHAGALLWLDFSSRTDRPLRPPCVESDARTRHVVEQLGRYFAGEQRTFELELAAPGTPFQRAVWNTLRTIPFGSTVSYGELARELGRPKSARAVGRANALNPIAIVVPCHRVIGADGTLTGYAGGLDKKRALLAHERRFSEPTTAMTSLSALAAAVEPVLVVGEQDVEARQAAV